MLFDMYHSLLYGAIQSKDQAGYAVYRPPDDHPSFPLSRIPCCIEIDAGSTEGKTIKIQAIHLII